MQITLLIAILNIISVKADTTTIYVNPTTSVVKAGETCQINISISQVTDLAGWDFKLYYPNTYLNATEIIEGPFLKKAGNTSFSLLSFTDNFNTTHGRIWAASVLIGQGPGASGNGTLAIITFKTKSPGDANLNLAETDLIDSKMPPDHIPHTTEDGIIRVEGVCDIAVISITLSKTVVGQGFSIHINVTVENRGSNDETFDLTTYANSTEIDTKTISNLASSSQTTITFHWNTASFSKGKYTIGAYAWPVSGENETSNNRLDDGQVIVTVPGDIDGNFNVDGGDLGLLGFAWYSRPGDLNWNANADINSDNLVDGSDLGILGLNWFKGDP